MVLNVRALHCISVNQIPYFANMTMGHYVTHVLARSLGEEIEPNGDVRRLRVIFDGQVVFTADTVNHFMYEVIPNGSTLNIALRVGGPDQPDSFPRGDSSPVDVTEYLF
jgi:hypothetical protein